MRSNSTAVRLSSSILYGALLLLASSAYGQVPLVADDALAAAPPALTAVVNCPPGALPEAEPCGSNTNGGCGMDVPMFEPLPEDATLCGTYWFDGMYRDTDWYEITLADPRVITVYIEAEAELLVAFLEQYEPGVPGCDNITGYFSTYAIVPPGVPGVVQSTCLVAGTHYLWAGATFSEPFPCPAEYVLTVVPESCPIPIGACCVGAGCTDMFEGECAAIGGYFYPDEHCADFTCPAGCPHSVVLYDSYGDGWNGNTLDLYVNGALVLDELMLPTGYGPVEHTFFAETGDTITTVYNPIGGWPYEPYYIIYDGEGYLLGQDGGNFVQPTGITVTGNCEVVSVGACCHADGACELTAPAECADGDFLGLGTQCAQCPCVVLCPPEGVPEAEECGADANGGCGMPVPYFEPLVCGITKCGTYWFDGYMRDTDWYQLDVPVGYGIVATLTLEGEAETLVGLIDQIVPGVPGCENLTGYFDVYAILPECTPGSITTECLQHGTYYFFVGTTFNALVDCPARYTMTFTCNPCSPRLGACCDDATAACTEYVWEYDCQAPLRFLADGACDEFSPPCGGCPEGTFRVEILTDNYPGETTWELVDDQSGEVLCAGGPYNGPPGTLFTHECCAESNCYTFRIYDSYGDGICCDFGEGYYNVYWNDALVASGGEFGHLEIVEQLGHCTGACCVAHVCVATNTRPECDLLGGDWFPAQDCSAGFTCPPGCLHRLDLYDSYGDGWNGNTLDVYVNGTLVVEGVTLADGTGPEPVYFLAETGDEITTVYHAVGQYPLEPYYLLYDGLGNILDEWHAADPPAPPVLANCNAPTAGACCYPDGSCQLTPPDQCVAGEFLGLGTQCFQCPCVVVCPPAAVSENEPCGTSTNAGCGAAPPAFEPIACNTIICGTSYYENDDWDTDWYVFVAPNSTTMTWSVEAEFPVLMGRVAQTVPGVPGCDNLAGGLDPYGAALPCVPVSVTFDVVAGGTYYLWVGPTLDETYACPAGYVATLTGDNCLCGDFDADGDVDVMDYYAILAAFGTCSGHPKYIAAADADGDNCITLVDYQSWLVCYEEANGAAFELPEQVPARDAGAVE